jgi:diguanylate cyclase (GGDEF)-like protein
MFALASRFRTASLIAALLASGGATALDPGRAFRDYELQRWGVEHGLPQITVLGITQDARGFLWVGTQGGFARFDGVRFVGFDRSSTGIDTTFAASAAAAADGSVWFGTPRGALHVADDRVSELSFPGTLLSVRAIALAADGSPRFATERGVLRAEGSALVPDALAGQPTLSLLAEGTTLWAGGIGRLYRLGPQTAEFALPRDLRVTQLLRRGDHLLLGTDRGAYEFDPATGALATKALGGSDEPVEAMLADRDGNLWLGNSAMLLRIAGDGRVERIANDAFDSRPWVNALFEDRDGDLWIGTRRESLYRARNSALRTLSTRDGLADALVWSVLDDRGGLLVGTNTDLVRLGADGRYAPAYAKGKLPQSTVYTLARDSDGSVWIGTRAGLAHLVDGTLSSPPVLAPLANKQVTAVLRDGEQLWIATLDGLFRLRGATLEAVIPPAGTADSRLRCIWRERSGSLLLCTEAGLRRLEGDAITKVPWAAAFDSSFVTSVIEVRRGLLAIGTIGSGLGFSDGERMVVVGPEEGLPSRNGWAFDVVGAHLYVGSLDGVYRLPLDSLPDPAAQTAPRVGAELVAASGYRAGAVRGFACCNGGGHARSARQDALLFYPSTEGVVRLDTAAIAPRPLPPLAFIETVHHADHAHAANQPHVTDDLDRNLAIDYTGVSFLRAYAFEFRYRLEGYDEDWIEAGNRRTAYYTKLPPGEFRFVVQARHPLGEWSAESLPLALRVEPLWWERRGLQALGVLLLLGLIAATWQARLAQLRERTAALERVVAERTGELARTNERLRVANQTLALENQTDPVTGLYNRRFVLNHAFRRGGVARANDRCAVMMIEVDEFKRINEQHGQGSGDRVLVDMGQALSACVRGGDIVARWTGVSFLLVLPGLDESGALELAERLRRRVAAQDFKAEDDSTLRISASIGFAHHQPRGEDDGAQLTLDLTDAALQRSKRLGHNRVTGLRRISSQLPASLTTAEVEGAIAAGSLAWVEITTTEAPSAR